jgi:hypothetical protein
MVVSPNVLPNPGSPQYSDPQPGTNSEQVVVYSSDVFSVMREWFITVTVPAGTNTLYNIRATTDRSGFLVSVNPVVLETTFSPTNITLGWTGILGQYYQLDTTTDLLPPIFWTPVLTNHATNRVIQISIPPPDPADDQRFYQLEQIPAP